MDYRFKNSVKVVRFPKGFEEESRGLKGCCNCKQLVLAHPSEVDTWKNDLTGVYVKLSDPSDSVTFSMEKADGTVITNLGTVGVFPNDTLAAGFIYEWKQILNTHGAGCYTVKANFTIAGISGGYTVGTYDLKPYSIDTAKRTVRLRAKFNSYYQKLEIDFTNSNFTNTVRFYGFFGEEQPKTEINNLIGKSRVVNKATRENVNEFTLATDPLDICITRQIKTILLNEDELFISDHNPDNHDYLLFDKPVSLTEGAEFEYIKKSRLAKVSATFGDKALTDKNYYNQN